MHQDLSNRHTIAKFLKEFFFEKIKAIKNTDKRIYLVMNNAIKSRVKLVKRFADGHRLLLVFIIINSPF